MQLNDDSSLGEGNQICDEDESLDGIIEPEKKTMHKKIFETTTVRPQKFKIQKTDENGPSLMSSNKVTKFDYCQQKEPISTNVEFN